MSTHYAMTPHTVMTYREALFQSDPDGVALLPGVVEGLRRLRDFNLGLAVVTNQMMGRAPFKNV